MSHPTRPVPSRTAVHPAGADLPATQPVADRPTRAGQLAPVASRAATTTVPPAPAGAVVAPLPRPALRIVPTDPAYRGAPTVAATVASSDPAHAASDDGSLVAEYGLLAVVAATVAGVLISWASSGALASFFGQLLEHARSLVVS